MDGNNTTKDLKVGTAVKARIYIMDNPKATATGTIIDYEKYPCGMILYTIKLHTERIVYRFENELVPLQP